LAAAGRRAGWRWALPPAPAFREGVNVLLARTEKIQKEVRGARTAESACFLVEAYFEPRKNHAKGWLALLARPPIAALEVAARKVKAAQNKWGSFFNASADASPASRI